jgi:hypothetical protein
MSASTGTTLTVVSSGSGTTTPIFSVKGSTTLPIFEVFGDSVIIGDSLSPSLYATKRVTSITSPTGTNIYSFPISAYTSAFVDYYISGATGLRAGNMIAIWDGVTVQSTETSTNDIGTTTPVTFGWLVSGNFTSFRASATTGTWVVESIVRAL